MISGNFKSNIIFKLFLLFYFKLKINNSQLSVHNHNEINYRITEI